MRCALCNDQPSTVQDVLDCKTCRDDGTANEIPKTLPADELLSTAVIMKPALENRFLSQPPAPRPPIPADDVGSGDASVVQPKAKRPYKKR